MKTTQILAAIFALFMVFSSYAEVPNVINPRIQAKITPEQIRALQKAAPMSPAGIVVLNFEGMGNHDRILQFYGGGQSELGYTGTNYGIYFSSIIGALIDEDAGGTGNFANEPSPSTVMNCASGILNVPEGFMSGISFYYCMHWDGVVSVYDGLNGTGNLLTTQPLLANSNINCTGDPNGTFCHWDLVNATFSGTAKSIALSTTTGSGLFDDFTFVNITSPSKIVISQTASSGFVGVSHTLTAHVTDPDGNPSLGKQVTFSVGSGPNTGVLGTAVTDVNGNAALTYTGTLIGVDNLKACFAPVSTEFMACSNEISYEWIQPSIPTMSQWGLILLAISLLGIGTVSVMRRKKQESKAW